MEMVREEFLLVIQGFFLDCLKIDKEIASINIYT